MFQRLDAHDLISTMFSSQIISLLKEAMKTQNDALCSVTIEVLAERKEYCGMINCLASYFEDALFDFNSESAFVVCLANSLKDIDKPEVFERLGKLLMSYHDDAFINGTEILRMWFEDLIKQNDPAIVRAESIKNYVKYGSVSRPVDNGLLEGFEERALKNSLPGDVFA